MQDAGRYNLQFITGSPVTKDWQIGSIVSLRYSGSWQSNNLHYVSPGYGWGCKKDYADTLCYKPIKIEKTNKICLRMNYFFGI